MVQHARQAGGARYSMRHNVSRPRHQSVLSDDVAWRRRGAT